jgi:hypothetical protein
MSEVVALVDLDDTLFQTLGKCRPGDELTPAALDRQGRPLSFMGRHQRILMEVLLAQAIVVPVTARDLESYARTRLTFHHGAIVSYGGLILAPSGQVDARWLAIIRPQAQAASKLLNDALAFCQELIKRENFKARARLVADLGLTFYLIAKTQPDQLDELAQLAQWLKERFPAKVYLNGNNLAFLPPWLDKAPAAQYFLENHLPKAPWEYLLLGLGDSLSDLGFVSLCDFIVTPSQGQLAKANWPMANL